MELCQLTPSKDTALRTTTLCNKRLEPHTTLNKAFWIFPINFNSTYIKLSHFFSPFFSAKFSSLVHTVALLYVTKSCVRHAPLLFILFFWQAFVLLVCRASMAGTSAELAEDPALWMRRKKKQAMHARRKNFRIKYSLLCQAAKKCHCLEIIDLNLFLSKLILYLLIKMEYI